MHANGEKFAIRLIFRIFDFVLEKTSQRISSGFIRRPLCRILFLMKLRVMKKIPFLALLLACFSVAPLGALPRFEVVRDSAGFVPRWSCGGFVVTPPAEGLWSIATAWRDGAPAGWRHVHAEACEQTGGWTILSGELACRGGRWLLRDAYREAFATKTGIYGSSYANTMMADLGYRLYFAAGSDKNIKLTTKDDLELFKAYVKADKDRWLK